MLTFSVIDGMAQERRRKVISGNGTCISSGNQIMTPIKNSHSYSLALTSASCLMITSQGEQHSYLIQILYL